MALLLILAIIEDYNIIKTKKSDTIISDKKIIDNILPCIQMDTYKIIIPHKIEYRFKVYGENLAVMKSKKLD